MTRNKTRWSFTFLIIKRYLRVCEHIGALADPEIDALMLSPGEDRKVRAMISDFEKFEEVTKVLQKESTTLADARDM